VGRLAFGPLTVLALVAATTLPGTALAATTWQVAVGAQSPDAGKQANFFFTKSITIDAGDTVTWTSQAGEIHTVTFLAGGAPPPLFTPDGSGGIIPNGLALGPTQNTPSYDGSTFTNSGVLPLGVSFSLSFPTPGDYPYVCLVHSQMKGTVHVQQAGATYPRTQASYNQEASIERSVALGVASVDAARGFALAAGPGQVTAGIGQIFTGLGSTAVLRFEPTPKVIRAGQSITWTNRDPETPHTVTFGTEPPNSPFGAFAPSGTPIDGPGHATITSPNESLNSGFIGKDLPFGTSFTAKFTEPGTYTYFCALHDDLGMKNDKIIVLPKQ
jgi:plastocyanin